MRSALSLVLCFGLLAGCTNEMAPIRPTGDGTYRSLAERPCPENNVLTWENFGEGIIAQYCSGCHSHFYEGDDRSGAPPGVDIETWDDVLLWAERIHVRTVEQESMPPSGGLSEAEISMFDEWMRCEVFPAAGRAG